MIQTVSITFARRNFSTLISNVQKNLYKYIITVKGIPTAILIPMSEYNSLNISKSNE